MLDYFWLFSLLCVVFEKEWLFSYVCVSHFSLYQPHSVHANGFHDVWDVFILYKYIFCILLFVTVILFLRLSYLARNFPGILHLLFYFLFSILVIFEVFLTEISLIWFFFPRGGHLYLGYGKWVYFFLLSLYFYKITLVLEFRYSILFLCMGYKSPCYYYSLS